MHFIILFDIFSLFSFLSPSPPFILGCICFSNLFIFRENTRFFFFGKLLLSGFFRVFSRFCVFWLIYETFSKRFSSRIRQVEARSSERAITRPYRWINIELLPGTMLAVWFVMGYCFSSGSTFRSNETSDTHNIDENAISYEFFCCCFLFPT